MRGSMAFLLAVGLSLAAGTGRAGDPPAGYHSPEQVVESLAALAKVHPDSARVHSLGRSAGARPLTLLELGPGGTERPGVLVLANLHGDCPPASEAALLLAEKLSGPWRAELDRRNWYLLPVGNPDGYARFFDRPLSENTLNARPVNADHDDATDEDGPADLDGDGLIAQMRQAHPEGGWLDVEGKPGLMKKADAAKGERGAYRLFVEGRDADGDGRVAEDGPGGVDPGRNYPHNFKHHTGQGGLFAGSAPETRAVLAFAYAHPRIGLVLVLGRTNTLLAVPAGTGGEAPRKKKYKVPETLAERLGLHPQVDYPLDDLVRIVRDVTGKPDMSEDDVIQFLDAGAGSRPDPKDAAVWKAVTERYQAFVEQVGLDAPRQAPAPLQPGSAEEWAYYQFGVPTFALDVWWLPKAEEEGKEKQGKGPTAVGAAGPTAAVEAATEKPDAPGPDPHEAALYDLRPDAFLPWRPYRHPSLGPVEIGGRKPWSLWTPPADEARARAEKLLPFARQLAGMLPELAVARVDVTPRAKDVWLVEAWVENRGLLPYPTHQGQRCERPSPVVVTATGDGLSLLEGRERTVLGPLAGSGGAARARWLVRARAGTRLRMAVEGYAAGRAERVVVLERGGGR